MKNATILFTNACGRKSGRFFSNRNFFQARPWRHRVDIGGIYSGAISAGQDDRVDEY